MTSSGIFLKSAYKTPANFNDSRSGRHGLAHRHPGRRANAGTASGRNAFFEENSHQSLPVALGGNNILRENGRCNLGQATCQIDKSPADGSAILPIG
jgi:hypothetical protein